MAQPVHTRPHMAQRARELIPQISGANLEPREEEVVGADYTQLVAGRDGSIEEGKRHGLLDFDTRILSRHRLTLDGSPLSTVSAGAFDPDRWTALLRLPLSGGDPAGPAVPQDVVEVLLTRRLGPGMLERIEVRNHSMAPRRFQIDLALDADFADIQEVGRPRRRRGRIESLSGGQARERAQVCCRVASLVSSKPPKWATGVRSDARRGIDSLRAWVVSRMVVPPRQRDPAGRLGPTDGTCGSLQVNPAGRRTHPCDFARYADLGRACPACWSPTRGIWRIVDLDF